jgi:DNA-binding response OmpR family regulator
MKILAVDDDETHRDLLALSLKKMQFHNVKLCDSAEDALVELKEETAPYECFLLDIDMPGMDGIELCRQIREMPKYELAPIVMLSGLSDRVHIEAAFDAGASDYLTKPFDELELRARLYLAKKHGQQRHQFARVRAEVEDIRSELGKKKDFTVATPLELEDVSGSIEHLALENFLLQTAGKLGIVNVIAVKIGNVAEIFQNATSSEFRFAVNSVGDAIAETLRLRQYFMSYAGNGQFPIILRDGLGVDPEAFSEDLACNAEELEIRTMGGELLVPQLFVGSGRGNSFFPRRANLRALTSAIHDAEERATRVTESPISLGQSKVGPIDGWLEWLKAS